MPAYSATTFGFTPTAWLAAVSTTFDSARCASEHCAGLASAGGHKTVLERTTANCAGSLFVTRYVSGTKVRLSGALAAGKVADKMLP